MKDDEIVQAGTPADAPKDDTPKEPDDDKAKETEKAEADAGTEGDKPSAEAETEEAEEEPRKPKSGFAREKIKRLAAEARAQKAEAELATRQQPQQKPLERPQPEQFTDFKVYERALDDYYDDRAALRTKALLDEQQVRQEQTRQVELQREAFNDFGERWAEFEQKTPDARAAAETLLAQTGPLNPTLRDQIAESEYGESILYYLGKNPGIGKQLNGLSPLEIAKAIGGLEEKMSLPKARRETRSPPLIKTPSGGAQPPRDLYQMAARSEDISDYVKARKADLKKD